MTHTAWFEDVEAAIEERSLLKHPFYRAWQEGRLSKEDLGHYAKAYYPHVKAFPRYVSATHSVCEDASARKMLVGNLVEEEGGEKTHPELWHDFAEGLGVAKSELGPVSEYTKGCIEVFENLSSKSALSGLAALYAYESQIPAVSRTKIQGLKQFYGVERPETLEFFKVHEEADVWHAGEEKKVLLSLAQTAEQKQEVLQSVKQACDAVGSLLDGICRERGIACN